MEPELSHLIGSTYFMESEVSRPIVKRVALTYYSRGFSSYHAIHG